MPRLSKIGAAALAAFGWTLGGSSVTASYLQVAGGGGGGTGNGGGGGGGGAGGYLTGSVSLNPTLSYTIVVGAGGSGGVTNTAPAVIGNTSSISGTGISITNSVGGGAGGGSAIIPTVGAINTGGAGGSGGGGGNSSPGASGGAGTSGQGNTGGSSSGSPNDYGAGGGGGASAVGGNGTSSSTGNGGAGTASSITGSSVTYAGGGGGGNGYNGGGGGGSAGTGGSGGGGNGGAQGSAGTANTGGGGGGGNWAASSPNGGGKGGSGIVIISYAGAQQFSGGIVTSVGGNTIHTFTTSGTLGPITTLSASYLIVAGGGGGGGYFGGGGGAGGLLSGSGVTIDPNSTYLVTVGAGGAGGIATGTVGTNGSNSSFSMVTTASVGGGGGGSSFIGSSGVTNGQNGGSGGGAGLLNPGTPSGGTATSGQGNAGGSSTTYGGTANYGCAGGGGAGAVGANGNGSGSTGGSGGSGSASSISGTSVTYAGGGGGSGSVTPGSGGSGGGGAGGTNGLTPPGPTDGTANTGGGGGGSGQGSGYRIGGAGGSGVVIISYAGATQQMAGGTVTIVGGNVIHTFTSTGYLAPIDYSTGSLRFRQSNSGYLLRTPTVAGNRNTWTWSAWVKRGRLSYGSAQMFASRPSSSPYALIYFGSDDTFQYDDTGSLYFKTNAVFRDPAAWYHLVITIDTTQATNTNRIKVYVNGVQQTFASSTYPSQNYSTQINTATQHDLGSALPATGEFFDGEMTEINFVDGQALAPTAFGTFNSYGVWQPITYGGSYGTNGFYLPFNRQAVSYVGLFNGSNQYLSIASNSVFNQSGDFTIEYYANLTSNTNYQVVVGRGTGFITIQHSSDAGAMIRLVRYGQLIIATGGNVTAGKWNHFAIVRSGSIVTGYVNGIAVASGTDSTSTATGNALAIGQNSDGTNYFTGSISNVRYTNTAVYTSNFIPSTSALTAVSGTQLLTLQNSSIVDNSTNALSITNNNGVSTGQTYPFAYGIFNDQGPAGSNWTPSGISGAFGSTLDYLGDAPTLTSATVANYCTWNPVANPAGTLANGNLQITGGSTRGAWGTLGVSSGKFYWEYTVNSASLSNGPYFGFSNYSPTGDQGTVFGRIRANGGSNASSGVTASTAGSGNITSGVVGVALDMDTGTATIYAGNVVRLNVSAIPAGTYFPFFLADAPTDQFVLNAGQQPFFYTPPTGFVGLNTFNL
jgi:hypothetical protein